MAFITVQLIKDWKMDCIQFFIPDQKPTPRHSIMTRSKKVDETTTLAILKNVKSPTNIPEEAKENLKEEIKSPKAESASPSPERGPSAAARRGRDSLACAQYKTDKGYRCPNCQRCYNARKNLVRHVTLECGREPQYKCPHCAYSKHRRNELKKHIEKKHPAPAPAQPH